MGGTACHYSSYGSNNGCTSYPGDSVLSAGAIVGIVIGSLIGIAIIILLLVLACRLSRRNSLPSHQSHIPEVYNVRMDRNSYHESMRRSDMYNPSKTPIYYEPKTNYDFHNNA